MRRRRRTLPSPAIVVGSIALLAALGGTSFAALEALPRASVGTSQLKAGAVTSAKIKDGTVSTRDIANGSIVSVDVRNGSLLRADFGPGQLPAGPIGPQGPPGISGREEVLTETPFTSQSPKNVRATCPAGKKVVGGGVEVGGNGRNRVTVTENQPAGDNAWDAEAFEVVATAATWKLEVHAICANAS